MASFSKSDAPPVAGYVTQVIDVDYAQLQTITPEDGWSDLTEAGAEVLEMGLGWDKSTGGHGGALGWLSRKVGSDLDGVLTFYSGPKPVKYLGWDELDCFASEGSAAGSATHTGDNQTGEGAGDDETGRLDLKHIPIRITDIVLNATAFKKGSDMRRAKNITVTLYNSTGGEKVPVAWIEPSLYKPKNTIAVAHIRRKRDDDGKVIQGDGAGWELKVVDKSIDVKQADRDDFLLKSGQMVGIAVSAG